MKAGSKWSVPIEAMRAIKPEYRQHLKILKSPGTPRAPLTPAGAYQGQEGEKRRSHYPNYIGSHLGSRTLLDLPIITPETKDVLLPNWSIEIVNFGVMVFSETCISSICYKKCGFCKSASVANFVRLCFILCRCVEIFANVCVCAWLWAVGRTFVWLYLIVYTFV